jgi:hypothetical protein
LSPSKTESIVKLGVVDKALPIEFTRSKFKVKSVPEASFSKCVYCKEEPVAVLLPAVSFKPAGISKPGSAFKSVIKPLVELYQYISKFDVVGFVSKTPRFKNPVL